MPQAQLQETAQISLGRILTWPCILAFTHTYCSLFFMPQGTNFRDKLYQCHHIDTDYLFRFCVLDNLPFLVEFLECRAAKSWLGFVKHIHEVGKTQA